jgi:hypothetical protein
MPAAVSTLHLSFTLPKIAVVLFSTRSINIAKWLLKCPCRDMKHTTVFLLPVFLALIISVNALASELSISPASSEGLAFARYLASIQETTFTESGPVALEIDASLPGLFKRSRMLAVRRVGESERNEYALLGMEGDATVTQEVVGPYFKAQDQIDDLPLASVEITPKNYKFRYKGVVGSGARSAYVYQIIPRKKRDGLVEGQLWIDSSTGAAVLQTGYFVKTPSAFLGRVEVVRDTKLLEGRPSVRITHVAFQTRWAGRGELTITEIPLTSAEEEEETSKTALSAAH